MRCVKEWLSEVSSRAAALLLLGGSAAHAQVVYTVASDATVRSPDGKMIVTMRVNGEGRPEYSIRATAARSIDWSRLGFILADAPKLERNFELASVDDRSRSTRPGSSPGASGASSATATTSCACSFVEKTARSAGSTVVFRVFDDGVGFRYEFPEQPQLRAGRTSPTS